LIQGNDTDSFGATAGSILGTCFGPEGLDERWLAPFNDDLHTGLARCCERSLSKMAKGMWELPNRIATEMM
jgi:ADP-ribosylglycohydrolase